MFKRKKKKSDPDAPEEALVVDINDVKTNTKNHEKFLQWANSLVFIKIRANQTGLAYLEEQFLTLSQKKRILIHLRKGNENRISVGLQPDDAELILAARSKNFRAEKVLPPQFFQYSPFSEQDVDEEGDYLIQLQKGQYAVSTLDIKYEELDILSIAPLKKKSFNLVSSMSGIGVALFTDIKIETANHFITSEFEVDRWLLGRDENGQILQDSNQAISVYGDTEIASKYISINLARTWQKKLSGQIVIDTLNQMYPILIRKKSVVSAVRHKGINLFDITGSSSFGFNFLRQIPNEPASDVLERWKQTFRDYGVRDNDMTLLDEAILEVYSTFSSLIKWFSTPQRMRESGILVPKIRSLMDDRHTRTWYTDKGLFDNLSESSAFINVPNPENESGIAGYTRAMLINGAMIGGEGVKLVINSNFPWKGKADLAFLGDCHSMIANGPHRPGATLVLLKTTAEKRERFRRVLTVEQFEVYELLTKNEGLVVYRDNVAKLVWK